MAESATLGKLFVDLMLRDEQFQKGLKDSGKALTATGKQFDAYAKTINGALVGAMKAATAASVGLLAASAAVGSGFEKQMDAVAAVRGITSETSFEFKALEETARNLGSTTAFSATEAAQGMEALARAGLSTNEIIAASETALKLAGAGQIELGRSAEILAGTMAQFGLKAEETTRIADVFTAAAQNTLFGTEDLAQAMKFAGTVGAAFGKDIEETTAAVAQFRNLGLEGTMAGTQFRMMMAKAASPTQQAADMLKKYGLTIEDISPETNSFADILESVGKAGISGGDAMAIFGTKAGANVSLLASKFAESTDDYDTLLGTLREAGEEGVLTSETYEQMTDNVIGRLAQLRSVVEETMISLFQSFRVPLTELLEALVGFMGAVAVELGSRGMEIGSNFEGIFGTITDLILDNTATGAAAMVEFIITMQNAASALLPLVVGFGTLLAAITPIIPYLDDMAIILGTIFAAQKAAALVTFVAGLWSTVAAAGGAAASLTAMGTAMVAATGGIAAITIAIGVLITGLALLVRNNMSAADSTRELQSAQEDLAKKENRIGAQFFERAQKRLVVTKEQMLAEREAAASSDSLSASRKEEIETILALSDATAAQQLRTGELIESGSGLRTVSGLLGEGMEGFLAVGDEIEKVTETLAGFEQKVETSSGATKIFAEKRVREWQERLFSLRGALVDASAAQSKQTQTQNDARDVLRGLAKDTDEATEATDNLAESQSKFADEVASRMRALSNELRSIGLSDSEAEAERLLRKRSEIERFFEAQIVAEEAQGARLEQLRKEQSDALAVVDEIGRRESLANQKALEAKAVTALTSLRLKEATEAVKIAAERDRVLAELAGASAETREQIAEEYNRQIRELAEEEIEPIAEAWSFALGDIGRGFSTAASKAKDFGDAIGSALGKIKELITEISGFGNLDLGAVTDDVLGAKGEAGDAAGAAASEAAEQRALDSGASEEQAAAAGAAAGLAAAEAARNEFDLTDAAIGFVETMISEAVTRAAAFAEIAGEVLASLAEQIPVLLQAVTAAIPTIALAFAESIPDILNAVVDNLAPLISALLDAMQTVLLALLDALPVLVEKVLAMLPGIITQIAAMIPVLLEKVVEVLPLIINAIIAAIPPILMAIIDAIPVIVLALVDSIPTIITEILLAIPRILDAVLSMVPHLITTVVGMLPGLVESLVEQLPDLINAVVSLIPVLVLSIIEALPAIAMALLEAIFIELVPMLPKMVTSLFVAIVAGMGKAMVSIAEGIWNAIKGFFNIFKKKDGKGGGSGAYSGMSYVPATMRMTLHKGEAVVPADRNAERVSGAQGPSPAGAAQNGMGGGGGGGGSPIDIAIIAEGRLLDAVQVQAMKRGGAVGMQREIRRSSGVRVGLDRGRFNPWSK